ncbi:S-adenosyl-L-methionine-dependent methyltransferase, partial [Rhizophagus irregularis]
MPAPGGVDFIYCGPPCQGFSGVNRYQKADDIKNSLVATALSYVDFYRPEFFLLENVRGMLSFRLGGKQDGNKILGGIKMGVIKFIIRSLTAMGYQTKFSVQQAGHHGVPQSRRR